MSALIGDPRIFVSELIWTVINFVLLMLLLRRFLFRPILQIPLLLLLLLPLIAPSRDQWRPHVPVKHLILPSAYAISIQIGCWSQTLGSSLKKA